MPIVGKGARGCLVSEALTENELPKWASFFLKSNLLDFKLSLLGLLLAATRAIQVNEARSVGT